MRHKLQSARTCGLAVVLSLLDFIWYDAGIFAGALVDMRFVPRSLAFALEFVAAGAKLSDGLLSQQLLERPFLYVLLLVFFQLGNELHSTLQDGALVLLAAWNNFGELVDAFVDGLTTATFDCRELATKQPND